VMLALFRSLFPLRHGYPSSGASVHATHTLPESCGYAYTDKESKEYVRQYPFLDR
jgi:hypothetical protein